MGTVFVSYRREDAPYAAAWLYEKLCAEFGADAVFKDVDDIQPGQKWRHRLKDALFSADVAVAVIGYNWSAKREDSSRRIDDRDDPVRQEIVDALRRHIEVIPVLVGPTGLPPQLPDDLAPLHNIEHATVAAESFETDVERLIRTLRKSTEFAASRKRNVRQQLDRALVDYEEASKLPFGSERTNRVHRVVQTVSRLAMGSGLTSAEIDERLLRDQRTGALLLLGLLRTEADPRRFQETLEAIESPSGPQEQFLALDVIENMLPLLTSSEREEVALVLNTQPYLNDHANRGRYQRTRQIVDKIEDWGPAFS